jgi:hypothetical protein
MKNKLAIYNNNLLMIVESKKNLINWLKIYL